MRFLLWSFENAGWLLDIFVTSALIVFIVFRFHSFLVRRRKASLADGVYDNRKRVGQPTAVNSIVIRTIGVIAGAVSVVALLEKSLNSIGPLRGMLDDYDHVFRLTLRRFAVVAEPLDALPGPFPGWWRLTALMSAALVAAWWLAISTKQVRGIDLLEFLFVAVVSAAVSFAFDSSVPVVTAIFSAILGTFIALLLKGLIDLVVPNNEVDRIVGTYVLYIIVSAALLVLWAVLLVALNSVLKFNGF